MKAIEYSGYIYIRGAGCRSGFCGACATIYRKEGDFRLRAGLACQTVVEDGMYLTQIPFVPAQIALYNIDDLEPTAEQILNLETEEISLVRSKTTIIATGGGGRLHYQGFPTTNHYGATADGLVLAYRVGAELIFPDSMQYHPTGVAYPEQIVGQLVTEKLRSFGIDITKEPILVYPTLHYQNGGIEIDAYGATEVPNLYVAGEASGGIHGRNRLMGNSTLDIFVFGRRAGKAAAEKARKTELGKLCLDHLIRWQNQLTEAGLDDRPYSPLILPDYTRPLRKIAFRI